MTVGRSRLDAIEQAVRPSREHLILEGLLCSGARLNYDGKCIPQPVAGTMTLLEALKHPYTRGVPGECSGNENACLVDVLNKREEAVNMVLIASQNEDPCKWYREMNDLEEPDPEIAGQIMLQFNLSSAGFNFIPGQGGGEDGDKQDDKGPDKDKDTDTVQWGAEWLAAVTGIMGGFNVKPFEAVWRIPLIQAGFCAQQHARSEGVKNVGRQNTLDWNKVFELYEAGDLEQRHRS